MLSFNQRFQPQRLYRFFSEPIHFSSDVDFLTAVQEGRQTSLLITSAIHWSKGVKSNQTIAKGAAA
jgi:hypothetical protein